MTRDRQPAPPPRGDAPTPWRPPTRRTFVAMLGAAAAAVIGARQTASVGAAPRAASAQLPRWIGHC